MGSLPEDFEELQPPFPTVLSSPHLEKVSRLKRELTKQLFIRQGEFWDAVSEMRTRWSITAQERLPELPKFSPFPKEFPPDQYSNWLGDIAWYEREVVPEGMRRRPGHWWTRFVSACVLYDPPELALLEFAAYGEPLPIPLPRIEPVESLPTPEDILERAKAAGAEAAQRFADQLENRAQESKPNASQKSHRSFAIMPSVVTLRDPYEVEEVERWYWVQVVRELIERYIRPQGLDVGKILEEILRSPELWGEYLRRMEHVPKTHYISVDEYTSEADVKNARRLIRETLEQNPGGRPLRDPLVALQCAVLYDRHNGRHPEDGRRRVWTHEKLAVEFDLESWRAAKAHVQLGRELLNQ
jgi:hypothetical protein